jgi:dolichyl-diphosphooligosaccharide--protein glycosyltransferase
MVDVREETATLLDERPKLAEDLRTLVSIDREHETWTFDEIPLDSGAFGELVSRGIATEAADGYQLANRRAVRVALGDDDPRPESKGLSADTKEIFPDIEYSAVISASIALSLLFVAIFRIFVYPQVFRGEHVVLLGNDPYLYRYYLLSMLDSSTSSLNVPPRVETGEPLLIAVLVGVARMLGGSTDIANFVLAWYPVVVGIGSALLTYVLAVTVTRDRRVALASVLILAVLPAHAYRTALGFADHHAFDFLWLAVSTLAAIKTLPATETDESTDAWRGRLLWVAVLAVGIAAQAHSWNAAPLLFVPFVAYAVGRSATLVRTGASPRVDGPLVAGIGIGGVLAVVGYLTLNWQSLIIVTAPILAAATVAFAGGMSVLVRRFSFPAWTASILTAGSGLLALGIVISVEPAFGTELSQELSRLVGMSGSEIVETKSLFSPDYGLFVGPLFFYGTALVFALPAGAWAFYAGLTRPRWLLMASYGLVLFVLAVTQVRFAGELSLFVAVFSGFAFVYFLDVVDITEPPQTFSQRDASEPAALSRVRSFSIPDRRTILSLGLVFLLVAGSGMLLTPLRTNTLVVDDDSYNAATWMESTIESPDWTRDQQYVFSSWSRNRMYNAFVNGDSRSYGYARSNYDSFLSSTDGSAWYNRLRNRAGFIVIDHSNIDESATETVGGRLVNWGSGLGHYRAVWASDDGEKKVYTLVPGAIITGTASPDTTVTVTHDGTVSGQSFTYERTVTTAGNGTYTVRVPYAGTYEVGDTEVHVSEEAVQNESQVRIPMTEN